jgi:hypothetical protein
MSRVKLFCSTRGQLNSQSLNGADSIFEDNDSDNQMIKVEGGSYSYL